MPARRCPICLTSWPRTDDYKRCPNPNCEGQETDRFSNVKAISRKQAESLKKHYEFDAFYEQWDEEQAAERLDPANSKFLQSVNFDDMLPEPRSLKTVRRTPSA